MKKIKIVFIGGLSNGAIVLDYLKKNKYVDIPLIFTYPDDLNLPRSTEITVEKNTELVKTLNVDKYSEKLKKLSVDFIFVAGWSNLISDDILKSSRLGVVGFHPSKLPFDRGRSVLAWQIEEGYNETALTMFFYNNYPDGGDIIGQEKIKIEKNDYIDDVLIKVDKATRNLMQGYFPLLRKGILEKRAQKLTEGNFRRLRNAEDSQIDWGTNALTIFNKVRAISKPYPGAEATIDGKKYKIWKGEIIASFHFGENAASGTLVAKLFDDTIIIKCRDAFFRILEYETF